VSTVSWLWPYCRRKGAERPDLQQCTLPVKERSIVTWLITVQITSEGREQSDLTYNLQTDCGFTVGEREQSNLIYNSAYYQWRKGAKRPDVQFTNWLWPYCCVSGRCAPFLQQYKLPVKEGSTATWCTILLTVSQTIVGREQSDLMDNTICCCTDRCWKGAKWSDLNTNLITQN